MSIDAFYAVDCVYSFLHNGGARFIPSPEGEGSSLPLHPDVITEEDEPDVIKSEAFIMGDHNSAVGSILQHPSSQDDDTTLDADETQSVLYG